MLLLLLSCDTVVDRSGGFCSVRLRAAREDFPGIGV